MAVEPVKRVDPTKADPSQKTTRVVDNRIRDALKEGERVDVPELTDKTIKWLVKDKAFVNQFIRETLRPLVYSRILRVISGTRGLHVVGNAVLDDETIEERSRKIVSKFVTWYEHAGGSSIRLMRMNETELRTAADERFKRGRTEMLYGKLWLKLAERLEADQVVEDVWSAEEIEALSQKIAAEQEN